MHANKIIASSTQNSVGNMTHLQQLKEVMATALPGLIKRMSIFD